MSKLNTYRRRMKYLSVYAITKPRTAPSSRIPCCCKQGSEISNIPC